MASFSGELQLNGKTATGIEVPTEIVESLGAGKRRIAKCIEMLTA